MRVRLGWILAMAAAASACGDAGGDATPGSDVATGDAGSDATDATDAADTSSDAVPDGAGEDAAVVVPPQWCESSVHHRYDPWEGVEVDMFPDALLTIDDPSMPTGRRVSVADAPWLDGIPALLRPAFDAAESLSGFGTLGGVILRFDTALIDLPADGAASTTSEFVRWYDLSTQPPARVPFEAESLDDGATLLLWPLLPLKRGTEYGVVVMRDTPNASGECISPAPALRSLLMGDEQRGAGPWASAGYARLLESAELAPDDIGAATVFVTHDDVSAVADLADLFASEPGTWAGTATCEEDAGMRHCERRFVSRDLRTPEGYVSADVEGSPWELPVSMWMPTSGDGPWPTLVFGHGINSERGEARSLARRVVPLGFAVVAADAMEHGEHPTTLLADGSLAALRFLGIDLEALALDVLGLRGNFDQTAVDRALLVDLLVVDPDLDDDGLDDVDATRIGYVGISLGGMLGPSLLALAPDIDAAVLFVAGGRLMDFVTDTSQVVAFEPLIISLVGSRALFDRLVPIAQAVVDPADPATWAAVLTERPNRPHLLMPVSAWDDTVPPSTGRALARALDLPHAGPVVTPVDMLRAAPALPFSGNEADGISAAYMQYDRVTSGDGVEPSGHNNTPFSPEAWAQAERFLTTWAAGETPEIIDPYALLGTPPLETPPPAP